ncbi:MAG TPA: isochorismate synthase, partial [Solirubrobacteraceae bacterium]|nr:isochorismate synthase [Solirubrobacteraceae bacterium]
MALGTGSRSPFSLSEADGDRLAARLRLAVERSRRRGGQTLATISVGLPDTVDPSAVACASRRDAERWFLFEQPDRGREALAGLGEAATL